MDLSRILGTAPIDDAEEEAFVVFSQDIPSQSLGAIDSQAATLDVSVAGCDLVIRQSPGLLRSNRKEGTTGAVIWKVTPLLAHWLSSPTNFLFANAILSPTSTVLELGAGVSGIVALALGSRVSHYTATDQDYVLKLLGQNVAENLDRVLPRTRGQASRSKGKQQVPSAAAQRISVEPLDWETHHVAHMEPVDMVIACDCIYNESLVEPLNSTCAALCRRRRPPEKPTLCLMAQQLRSPDVFEAWLKSFDAKFRVWQVPHDLLGDGLREGSGFVVHVGIVR
ncbi:Ribosomal protein lysine methyltransferase [Pleosporales sp. CAS-2024a]